MQKGKPSVRAQFIDATHELAKRAVLPDPPPEQPRLVNGVEYAAGCWPGAPMDKLPPDCPVIPLGMDGKTAYFVDTLGQLMPVTASEWNKKTLTVLFAMTPHFPYWAWPRFAAPPKKGKADALPRINGLETDEAVACLVKAAGERGLFDPADKVRGRGAWTDRHGNLIWHSGEMLFRVEKNKLHASPPGDVDGMFYARRPPVLVPWPAPIADAETPALDILAALRTWTWERPVLDPVLMLGWLGAALLGGALPWRPTVFLTGGKGRGKSTLQGIVKALLGSTLHATADTTAAGIYQRVRQDSLPVAVDELEADDDNRKVVAVVKLARLASSGAEMFRGGQDHEGVQFRARNSFLFSSINTPPLEPQDKSRMAVLQLGKVDPKRTAAAVLTNPDMLGRQLLRRLMDRFGDFDRVFGDWRTILRGAGFDGRGQDTYGVLLAVASLLLTDDQLEDAGLPVTEGERMGAMLAEWTEAERAEQGDNWADCLDRILSWTIDNWKGGERPIVGDVLDRVRMTTGGLDTASARSMLMQAGLGLKEENGQMLLAVPPQGVSIEKIFMGTKFTKGVWMHALKQGPAAIMQRGPENRFVIKIAGRAQRCLLIDMAALEQAKEKT
jgi:hypothetical protein